MVTVLDVDEATGSAVPVVVDALPVNAGPPVVVVVEVEEDGADSSGATVVGEAPPSLVLVLCSEERREVVLVLVVLVLEETTRPEPDTGAVMTATAVPAPAASSSARGMTSSRLTLGTRPAACAGAALDCWPRPEDMTGSKR